MWSTMTCRELHRVGAVPGAHELGQDGVGVDRHRAGLHDAGEREVGRHLATSCPRRR